jgi:hypothetical protein
MYKPVRLYRGSTYVISSRPPEQDATPVIVDTEGYPIRWVPAEPRKEPLGFHIRRPVDDQG